MSDEECTCKSEDYGKAIDCPIHGLVRAGQRLTVDQIEEILETIKTRRKNFPNEPEDIAAAFVLVNFGHRYQRVACDKGEWVGYKKDVHIHGNEVLCPNGHYVHEARERLTLGWVSY